MTLQQLATACLAEPLRCGIYRMAAGEPTTAANPALCWKSLASLPHIDRASLLSALGTTLAFPDYYGQNWDAAWDCLTELDWPSGQLLALHLPIAPDSEVVEADLEIFLELLQDACQHWAERGRALCLLIECAPPGRACLESLPQLELLD